jgi:hypothetical protein
MVCFTSPQYRTYNKGEGPIMVFGVDGGDMVPPPTIWWDITPSLPRIPPTYTDKMTCFRGVNPLNEVRTPYPQKKFWKNF